VLLPGTGIVGRVDHQQGAQPVAAALQLGEVGGQALRVVEGLDRVSRRVEQVGERGAFGVLVGVLLVGHEVGPVQERAAHLAQ
jgi:hypothetical protein